MRLHHPATIRILDYGRTEHGLPYFALEYVRGKPLGEVIATRPLQPDQVTERIVGRSLRAGFRGTWNRELSFTRRSAARNVCVRRSFRSPCTASATSSSLARRYPESPINARS